MGLFILCLGILLLAIVLANLASNGKIDEVWEGVSAFLFFAGIMFLLTLIILKLTMPAQNRSFAAQYAVNKEYVLAAAHNENLTGDERLEVNNIIYRTNSTITRLKKKHESFWSKGLVRDVSDMDLLPYIVPPANQKMELQIKDIPSN